jgi:formylglycine-generating enzyme required for sulfatase activity
MSPGGSFAACRSDYGVYDMSGDVEEWNATDYAGKKGVRGGSFHTPDTPYLRCDFEAPPVAPGFQSLSIGFRCCKNP